jgi:hypothetical protein
MKHQQRATLQQMAQQRNMTVTVTYRAPYTTAPTKVQQHYTPKNTVIATVQAGSAGDTQAIVTHDFGLSNAEITQGFPLVLITPEDGNAITSPWFEISQASDYTILGKGTTAAGALSKVAIMRPATITR